MVPASHTAFRAMPAPRVDGLPPAASVTGSLAALTGLALAACGGGADDGNGAAAAASSGTAADAERVRASGLSATAATAADRVAYTAEELATAFAPDGVGLATAVEASRFLAQASFGPTVSSLAAVRTRGLAGWLDDQFVATRGPRLVGRVLAQRDALGGWLYTTPTFGSPNSEFTMNECWRVAMTEPDQLRQRVVAALLEIFVITTRVGVVGIGQNQVNSAAFVDMLGDHAFGNFRQLLEGVTLSTAMGVYLSYRDNQKAEYDLNGVETRVPDENFARELMQLFSIGLTQLNADGSPKLKKNLPQDTYTQSDVFNLARVFTGWKLQKPVAGEDALAPWAKPMEADPDLHSPEEKAFLGKLIPAGTGPAVSLKRALDTIFEHDNVGPFIGRQLIQRLVTSNPSSMWAA